jgi:hypothetical protein
MIGDALILRPLSRLFQPDVAPARRSLFAMALKTISVRGQSA